MSWHHKVERNDWETHKKHERLAMKSCLELMSGGRGGEEEEEEERDAKVIYANLLKEANVGGERHQARFESVRGVFPSREEESERGEGEHGEGEGVEEGEKEESAAARFPVWRVRRRRERRRRKEEKEDNKLEINLGPEVTEAVRLLEGRGVKMCNFFPKDKKKKLRSSTRLLTDAAMLKVALWFESVKDETVRKHVLRLEMCRSPLTSKEIEMKRRGKSIAKTLDARAESGAYGDDSLLNECAHFHFELTRGQGDKKEQHQQQQQQRTTGH